MKQANPAKIVVAGAAILHACLFWYDIAAQFEHLLAGDRSLSRWAALRTLAATPFRGSLEVLANGPVTATEFLFQFAAYGIGGTAGIVAFQIGLFLLSLYALCLIAFQLTHSRTPVLIIGSVYVLLPQNLAFTHQLVTEAIATPFLVFSAYFYMRYSKQESKISIILSALFLGLAIVVRPPLALVLPAFLLLHSLYRKFVARKWAAAAAMSALATLPLAAWATVFTLETGHIGYTAGVATLGWNLRSKVFFVYTRNNFEKPIEIAKFNTYSDMWSDNGGISVGRYLHHVAKHPVPFIEFALVDVLQLMRGNISKLVVDYFGVGGDRDAIKGWRELLAKGGLLGVVAGLGQSASTALLIFAELALSVLTGTMILAATMLIAISLLKPERIAKSLGPPAFCMILFQASVLFAVFMSSQIVDQAQGRLRHPAEAGLLLLAGLLWVHFSRTDLGKPHDIRAVSTTA